MPTSKTPLTKKQIYMRQKRRSARKFRKALGVYVLLLLVIILVAIIYLCISLFRYQKVYEKEQSEAATSLALERAPQEFFQNYISNMNISDWVDVWYMTHPERLDSEEDVSSFINEQVITPGFSCYKDPQYNAQSPSFLLRSENRDIASFTLSGQGMDWKIASITFFISGQESASITVPEGTQVKCNGVTLDDTHATQGGPLSTDFEYSGTLINPSVYETVTVNNLISTPILQADITGNGQNVSCDVHGNYYLILSDNEASTYRQQAETFVRALLHYYAKGKEDIDSNMSSVLSLVPKGSEASSIISQSYSGVIWRYPENISYNLTTSEVYILADNCYCVDVTYSSAKETAPEESDAATYRVYLLDLGAGFMIYSFSYL